MIENEESMTKFLEIERHSTDQSLVAEREKTNRSIDEARKRTERDADRTVSSERDQTDRVLSTTRAEADDHRATERKSADYDPKLEQRLGDERLRFERRRSDDAIEVERARTDGAVVHERELKSEIAHRLLSRERLLTDRSLLAERPSTDDKVDRASKRLNAEIAEHLKTKVSLTSRDEFIAIVSHDLRNPIGAASTCLALLLEDMNERDADPEFRHWVAFAKRNLDTSLRLISDLLDIERIAQGKLELKLGPIDVPALVIETIDTFAHASATKQIKLRARTAGQPPRVFGDHDRILQVLSNLVNNAIKFTPEGGTITIETRMVASDLQISVRDTGTGIAPEKLGQIFGRFTQLGSADRRGLGLGLYISKMFVEAHQGRMWVESTVDTGSTFYFAIPADLVEPVG